MNNFSKLSSCAGEASTAYLRLKDIMKKVMNSEDIDVDLNDKSVLHDLKLTKASVDNLKMMVDALIDELDD